MTPFKSLWLTFQSLGLPNKKERKRIHVWAKKQTNKSGIFGHHWVGLSILEPQAKIKMAKEREERGEEKKKRRKRGGIFSLFFSFFLTFSFLFLFFWSQINVLFLGSKGPLGGSFSLVFLFDILSFMCRNVRAVWLYRPYFLKWGGRPSLALWFLVTASLKGDGLYWRENTFIWRRRVSFFFFLLSSFFSLNLGK